MKAGGKDGANTRTGLIYEDKVDLATFIAKQKKYTVKDCGVLNLGECVAHIRQSVGGGRCQCLGRTRWGESDEYLSAPDRIFTLDDAANIPKSDGKTDSRSIDTHVCFWV